MAAKKSPEKPEISLSSTKQQLLDAYLEIREQLEEKAKNELKPEKIVEEKKRKETVEAADTLVSTNVVAEVDRLKAGIGRMLAELTDNLEGAANKYRQLTEAVATKTRELEELFEIEKSALTLASLIEAQQRRKSDFEESMALKKKELEDEIATTRDSWEREAAAHEQAAKEREAEAKKVQLRRQEEFEYDFKRKQEQSTNTLSDQKAKLEKEIAALREEHQKAAAEREKELKAREIVIQEKESRLAELERRAEAFPKDLEAQVGRAVKEAVQRARDEAEKSETLLKAEADGEKKVLQARIAALESVVADQNARLSSLAAQTEGAYQKVQEIALKAVEGSVQRQAAAGLERKLDAALARPGQEKQL